MAALPAVLALMNCRMPPGFLLEMEAPSDCFTSAPAVCCASIRAVQSLATNVWLGSTLPAARWSVQAPDLEIEQAREGDPQSEGNEAGRGELVERPEERDRRDDQEPLRENVDSARAPGCRLFRAITLQAENDARVTDFAISDFVSQR